LFGFFLIIVWISLFLCLDFPDSFENPGSSNKKLAKSKQKKSVFLLFGFRRIYVRISRIFAWITPILNILGRQSKIKAVFCLDLPDLFFILFFVFHLDPSAYLTALFSLFLIQFSFNLKESWLRCRSIKR
jgi:hypothetical protein